MPPLSIHVDMASRVLRRVSRATTRCARAHLRVPAQRSTPSAPSARAGSGGGSIEAVHNDLVEALLGGESPSPARVLVARVAVRGGGVFRSPWVCADGWVGLVCAIGRCVRTLANMKPADLAHHAGVFATCFDDSIIKYM